MLYCETQQVIVCPETSRYWLDGYWMPYSGDLTRLVEL